jgi:hypothetical protein
MALRAAKDDENPVSESFCIGCALLGGFVHGRRDSGGMQHWTNKAVTVGIKGVGMSG